MRISRFSLRILCTVVLAGLVLVMESMHRTGTPVIDPATAVWPTESAAVQAKDLVPVAHGTIPMPAMAKAAHASNLVAMPPSHAAALTAFWFAGDRESAPNARIAASQLDRASQTWSAARFVVDREVMGAQLDLGLRRLGNSVPWFDASGRMHLFVVATGWGGWAASRVLHLRQSSAGNDLNELTFEPVRLLPLSWLWNTSFLARNLPLGLVDGGMVLPLHFELGIKYPVVARFDRDGNFAGMVRLSQRKHLLQPALVMQTPTQWLGLLRSNVHDARIGVVRTEDGGRTWSDLPDLTMHNPDAAVAAMALAPKQFVLAHNPSWGNRTELELSSSQDGINWPRLHTLERSPTVDEYSYPSMVWADGALWVSYTARRQHIAWWRYVPANSLAQSKP
jgi:hypothetical protein